MSNTPQPSVTAVSPYASTVALARHVAKTGTLPCGVKPYWRSMFGHIWQDIPADLCESYGLKPTASWQDVGDAVEIRLGLKKPAAKAAPVTNIDNERQL